MKINGYDLPERVNILGTEYKFFYEDKEKDQKLDGADGYCELYAKEIHIDRGLFEEDDDPKLMKYIGDYGLKVIRHEIIHAFIQESGLWECCDWARSEELTDWIARQFPKMMRCFDEAKLLGGRV